MFKTFPFFSHRGAAETEEVGGTERGLVGEETLLPTSRATVFNTGLLHLIVYWTVLGKTLLSATG